ncbi:thiamine-phosphate kinase [Pleionea sp. CnH1-48]|uniref:thiamine-phosphate kinase n=1 Tax=Pleionea sp. CnH1-48 TaxID=2954494 RepID=UPI00209850CA|nr:thiamine-phosphate kinase [Pleionea sp. CnH1-48]MCO7225737.1 thiamine-phosphate kinase [Pleionea sp. CnH1-48]
MSVSEFNIIEQFFVRKEGDRRDVVLGIGDDCALLNVPSDQCLAVSMDTLNEGIHFLSGTAPADIAHKAIAVNLSDLAAMGAEPAWVSLSLSMPTAELGWLQSFSDTFHELLHHYGLQVIGGDTTRGPLAITLQVHGFVPEGVALKRSGAKAGDLVCVTGTLGDAALGLLIAEHRLAAQGEVRDHLLTRYYRPEPRVAAGIALRVGASAAIDVSDGLVADLGHICKASEVGAVINADDIPLSEAATSVTTHERALDCALTGGDDYELCFTVSEDNYRKVQSALESVGVACYAVGRISGKSGVRILKDGEPLELNKSGFDHFAS